VAGFEFHETLSGSFRLRGDDRDRPLSFTLRARSSRFGKLLRRREVEIEGAIDAEGFAAHRRLRGTLGLDAPAKRTLLYAFCFTANDGQAYRFEGKRTLVPARMVESITVLPGEFVDAAGAVVAEALLRFDLRSDLVRFVRSFRLA
jgi:hypothetical protein